MATNSEHVTAGTITPSFLKFIKSSEVAVLLHAKAYGGVPPEVVILIEPELFPLQFTSYNN